jgi:hypothetical protein
VARRSRIPIRKTRIRHQFRLLAESAIEEIDRFRKHVHDGRAESLRRIRKRADTLPSAVQELLAEEVYELDSFSRLADQLSIVALHRVVEINTGRMLAHEFGEADGSEACKIRRNASDIRWVKKFLKDKKDIKLKSIPHYRAIDELRALNNAIKHAERVTKELAEKNRRWHEGKELSGLDKAYERLRSEVPAYIFRLAERMKLQYKLSEKSGTHADRGMTRLQS